MSTILYFFIFVFFLLIVLTVWFIYTAAGRNSGYEFVSRFHQGLNNEELITSSLIHRIKMYTERGKWFAFASILLLLGEIFYSIVYFLEIYNVGYSDLNQKDLMGALIFLLLNAVLIAVSVRLAGGDRELPDIYGKATGIDFWDEKRSSMNDEEKNSFIRYLIDRHGFFEVLTVLSTALFSILLTILVIWFFNWLSKVIL